LTLNLGLRYEMVTVPTEVQGKLVNMLNITDHYPTAPTITFFPGECDPTPLPSFFLNLPFATLSRESVLPGTRSTTAKQRCAEGSECLICCL